MYKFVHQLNEIRKIFTQFRLIEIVLDLIIILLSVFIIFPYLGVKSGWFVSIPVLLYLVVALKYKFNKKIVKLIEEQYPALRERLSAAYDNKEQENVVVEDLASAILTDIEQVKYSSFISTKRLGVRIVIILLLVTVVLSTAIVNSSISNTESTLPTESKPNFFSAGETNIFNEPSFVRIGNETQGLVVYRGSGSEPNVKGERKQVPEYSRFFPPEDASPSAQTYNEAVPIIYHQIVKNYFTNLSGSR